MTSEVWKLFRRRSENQIFLGIIQRGLNTLHRNNESLAGCYECKIRNQESNSYDRILKCIQYQRESQLLHREDRLHISIRVLAVKRLAFALIDSTIIGISSALILASLRVDNDTDLVLVNDAEDEVVAGFAVEARQSEVGMGGGGGARPDGEDLDTNYRTCTHNIKEDVEEGMLAGDQELTVDEDAEEDWGKDTAVRAKDTKTEELELDEVELELEIDVLADLCLLVENWMSFDDIKITNFAISNSLLDGTSASGEGVASDNQI
ncbi:uncharacterized protein RSE6_12424 [Rhynchosporium secalis]|uniref:Uncharacterized protein n=1 Tax=Rhynchosporium secalis TaxID=38038 RepID=A0A1E1MQG6_RHYSE|nr:uncharacterized protein RSE6_12424 [Rhynchosporium secalis]